MLLVIPGRLEYRDCAVRAVHAAAKLTGAGLDFVTEVVSAFGEAFNNVALHAYDSGAEGELEIRIDIADAAITVRLLDWGRSFDVTAVPPPDLDALPESGLGLYILRACMDEVRYLPGQPESAGTPNVLSMTKRLPSDRLACDVGPIG
jgi:serine/threonine-protein kinase RsbW